MNKRAVLICPGRGTYNRSELGYIAKHHGKNHPDVASFDAARTSSGQDSITDLDSAAKFSTARHTSGPNASPLIYTSALLDAQSLPQSTQIVAVTGNSLGWYITLAAGGAVSPQNGFNIVNTTGNLMQESLIGGQLVYPFLDENWRDTSGRYAELMALIGQINAQKDNVLTPSIHLGGMLVLAGNEAGLETFTKAVPKLDDRFPMRLPNHAAFHSHLQIPVAQKAQTQLPKTMFTQPKTPMIDGRGHIWWPHSSDLVALWDYTFAHQITQTYDFTRAVQIAAKEFAPDVFIVTGPGNTLGGAVAQSLVMINWEGMSTKADFAERQKTNPILISMGLEEQRAWLNA